MKEKSFVVLIPTSCTQLLPFLHERNPQVRQIALSNLVGHTAKGSPSRNIFYTGIGAGGLKRVTENDCIRDLKLLCRDQVVRMYTHVSRTND